jgi:hypothetical protein
MSRLFRNTIRRAAAAAVILALTAFAPAAGAVTPPPAGVSRASMTISVPKGIAAEHGETTVTALVTNSDQAFLPPGTVSFWRAGRLSDRAAVTRWDSGTSAPAAVPLDTAEVPALAPGESATVVGHIARSDLGGKLHAAAVFAIGGTWTLGGATIATSRGTVVVHPGTSKTKRTRLAIAMPITVPAGTDGVLSASALARYTGPDGVLTRQVDGLLGYPEVAVGIDPRIVASIRALGAAAPRSALDWQQLLLGLPNEIFALQYGDADAAVQVQAGLGTLLKPTSFDWATGPANVHTTNGAVGEPSPTPPQTPSATSTQTPPATAPALPSPAQILAWPYTATGIVWPPDGTVSPQDLISFKKNSLTTVFASSTNVTGLTDRAPRAYFRSNGEDVLVSDAALSTALRQAVAADTETGWNAAMAQVSAQLALLPGKDATVLATLARAWPGSATRLARTLQSLDDDPGSQAVSLSGVLDMPPATGVSLRKLEEPSTRVNQVKSLINTEKRINSFASVLLQPPVLTGRERARLLSLLGVGWLDPGEDWQKGVDNASSRATSILSAVSIIPSGLINVASTEAPVPVTVENKLDHPIDVVLAAEPSNGRLEIDGTAHKIIPADARGTVLVPVKARLGNGRVDLSLQLYSQTGVPIGSGSMIPVDVHAQWEGVAAVVLAAMIVALFGFGVARNVRRHVRSRRAEKASVDG